MADSEKFLKSVLLENVEKRGILRIFILKTTGN